MELNNGRTLTIYDLGRVPLIRRVGLHSLVKENGWRFSVAGSVIRYRRRVKVFDKLKMRSRIVSWDERFLYLEQSMWRGSEATSQAVFRMAISNKKGLIPLRKVIEAFGGQLEKPDMPEWIEDWISSEFKRPWPPN
jgi:acyl-CoA thioesterase FadM